MTWTYTGNPATDTKDAVRLLIFDTRSDEPLMSDEEVLWAITETGGNRYRAAALLCRILAARSNVEGTVASKSVGDLSISYGSGNGRADYESTAVAYDRVAGLVAVPYAGGLSRGQKAAYINDPDLVQPSVWKGMTDSPDVGSIAPSTS